MSKIDEDIRNGVFHSPYLLYGEEDYMRRIYAGRLKNAVLPDGGDMNLSVWKGDDFDLGAFKDQALTVPFFAPFRLILVENSGLFKKGGADLAEFLPSVPEQTIVVFSEEEVDARGKLFKYVKSKGTVYECKRLRESELTDWILRRLNKAGRKITRSAMELFLERTGSDMNQISREMQKLIDYTEGRDAILPEDVRLLTTENTETKIFAMIDAISERAQSRALEMYYDLISAKESPIGILVMTGKQFERLCRVKELRERGLDQNSIAGKLGMQGFVVRKALGQASRFSMEELKNAVAVCVESIESVTTGRMADVLAGETAILRITEKVT